MEPQGLLIAFAAIAIALALYSVGWARREIRPRRRMILIAIRLAFLISLIALWYRPTVARNRYEDRPPHVAIVLDDSDSMSIDDAGTTAGGAPISREQRVDAAVFPADAGLIDRLSESGSRVTVHAMSDGRVLKDSAAYRPNRGESDLSSAIGGMAAPDRTSRPDAFVLVSDGADTRTENPAAYLESAVPVYTIGVGEATPSADLRIDAVSIPATVFREEPFQASVTVARSGGAPAAFRMRIRDATAEIASVTGLFAAESDRQTVALDLLFAEEGERTLTFDAAMDAPERETRNNRVTETILVLKEKRRIAVLMGAPNLETKFLLRALGEDLRLDARPLYLLPRGTVLDPLRAEADRVTSRDGLWTELGGADLVIASELGASGLTADDMRRLYDHVSEEGGNLLWLGGERGMSQAIASGPLARLFPFDLAAAQKAGFVESGILVTDRAQTLPGFEVLAQAGESRLPPLGQILRLQSTNPGAQVALATSARRASEENAATEEGYAVYIDQRYGLGKVGVLLGTGTWRWAMSFAGLPETDIRSKVHTRFWQGIVHGFFLGPGTGDLHIETNGTRFDVHENVTAWIQLDEQTASWFTEPAIMGEIDRPDGTTVRIPLSRRADSAIFEGRFSLPEPGAYELRARVGEREGRTKLTARASGEEFAILYQRRPVLEAIAQRTGGQYLDIAQADELPGLLELHSERIVHRTRVFAGQLPEIVALVLALAISEWILRRRWSLP